MSALIHLYSEFDDLRIDFRDDAVWIRGRHATVSLTLDARDSVKLRSALAMLSSKTDDLPDLNTDTPAPVAPRDMAAEAKEDNSRG